MNFDDMAQAEIEVFEAFKAKYQNQNPLPSSGEADGLGWQFWLAVAWALSSAIMVAVRTGNEFYKAEMLSGMPDLLAKFSSFNVLFALEGGITIAAALKASHQKSHSTRLLERSIWMIVAISVVAGINSSLGIIPNISPNVLTTVRIFLVGAIGIGGSFVVWASGEVVGAQISRVLTSKEDVKAAFAAAIEAYNDELLRSWRSSDEYRIVRSDVRKASAQARSEVREAEFGVRSVATERRPNSEHRTLKNAGANEQRERIVGFLVQVFEADGRVPGPTEIARECGVSKSYAHQVRNEWVEENSSSL